jgi:hypothetical protein
MHSALSHALGVLAAPLLAEISLIWDAVCRSHDRSAQSGQLVVK